MRDRLLQLRPKCTYGRDAFQQIFDELGLRTDLQKATFLNVAESTFSRTKRGVINPGEDFIASTMDAIESEPRLQGNPLADFKQLFPIKKLPIKKLPAKELVSV